VEWTPLKLFYVSSAYLATSIYSGPFVLCVPTNSNITYREGKLLLVPGTVHLKACSKAIRLHDRLHDSSPLMNEYRLAGNEKA
jgi:hypothetical protein